MYQSLKKRIYQKRWLSVLLQILFIAILFYAISFWQTKDAVRGEAPIIKGKLLTGETVSLKRLQGQPVLVHFWATWCPICKLENSSIAAIAKDYQVISIASWSENDSEIQNFLDKENLIMPVLPDHDGEWAKLYGVKAVPSSFIVDEKGVIGTVETGFTTEMGLRFRLWWYSK